MNLLPMHAWMRFPILFMAVVFATVVLAGTVRGRAPGRGDRIVAAIFSGLVDLQFLIGIGLLATGHMSHRIHGHLGAMVLTVALVHAASVMNRRRTSGKWVPAVLAVLAVVLIVAGVHLTGRPFFS